MELTEKQKADSGITEDLWTQLEGEGWKRSSGWGQFVEYAEFLNVWNEAKHAGDIRTVLLCEQLSRFKLSLVRTIKSHAALTAQLQSLGETPRNVLAVHVPDAGPRP